MHPNATRLCRQIAGFALLCLVALMVAAGAGKAATVPGLGQSTGTSGETGSLDAFLEQARKDGSTVIVVKPGEQAAPPNHDMPMAMALSSSNLLIARANIARMAGNLGVFLDNLPESLKEISPDGSLNWLFTAVATAVGGLILGNVVFYSLGRFGREHFRALYNPEETRRSGKLAYLLGRAGWMLVSAGVMFATAILVAVIFDQDHEPSRQTIWVIVSTYVTYRILRSVIFWNFFAPGAPAHRLINVSDEAAERLFRDWAVILGVAGFIIGVCRWIQILGYVENPSNPVMAGVNDDAHRLAFIIGMLICALMLATIAIRHRRELVDIILGPGDHDTKPAFMRAAAFLALPLTLLYLVAAWFLSSVRLALGLPGGYILVGAPIIVFVVAIFAYGVAALALELFYERRAISYRKEQLLNLRVEKRAWRRAQRAKEIMSEMDEEVRDMLDDGDEARVHSTIAEPSKQPKPYFPAFKQFFQSVFQATILVVSAGELARLWGVDVGRDGGHPLAAALDILLVLIIAAAGYRAVNGYIDYKIIEEGGTLDDHPANPGEGEGESGKGQSRVATLLPVIRNVVVAALIIFGGMIVLATVGVDVGPLFAGAGVIGLAIGFGAQTLIRDVFSGAFFLIDDAFRKGEYIEVGSIKGVVEKISMRSFQLRHHLGAVHTVPFGEIHQLTNYSRDWVMMKLPLRLTYDTDVEKVRKLIKKLGQQLLEDEVIGPLFVQPLKSQGVYSMEDSAMIVRVKFMTRPGDQFVTRKVVYAAIRELFQKEGIRFAHREVTVRLADGVKAENLSDEQKKAIAGSVRSVIEEQAPGGVSPEKAAAAAL